MQRLLMILVLTLVLSKVHADDVDIYLPQYQVEGEGGQPQVMIIVDTSASMATRVKDSQQTRIEVTKDIVDGLVRKHPGINFALSVFNANTASVFCHGNSSNCYAREQFNGGRVVHAFNKTPRQSGTERQALLDTVGQLRNDTSTPLCETMHEVYRYLVGQPVIYGKNSGGVLPARDMSVEESNGRYHSPLRPCENVYVIYMTDGIPQWDTSANADISTLTGQACGNYEAVDPVNSNRTSLQANCLPQLTRYMAENDLADGREGRPDRAGIQSAYTFTIGFTTQQQLLEDAAQPPPDIDQGYYVANDRTELDLAFSKILGSIIENEIQTQRFATATNLSRTENLNLVYSPTFLPRAYVPWSGNLKKFAFDARGDSNPVKKDIWSRGAAEIAAPDAVEQGGVGARLLEQVSSNGRPYRGRKIYTDIQQRGVQKALGEISAQQLKDGLLQANALTPALLTDAGYTPAQLVDWLYGRDVTNESETDIRPWIMGDIIHSQPLAINYGCPEGVLSCADNEQRIRIFVGTNEGMLHAIDDANGQERWAFWPQISAGIAVYRMLNKPPDYPWPSSSTGGDTTYFTQSTHYGIDGSPGIWLEYADTGASSARTSEISQAVLAFGFGRGGRGYYGLDVHEPDSSELLWERHDDDWGQSWSTPVSAVLRVGRSGDSTLTDTPVFMFGGGYDAGYYEHGIGQAPRGASFNIIRTRSGETLAKLVDDQLKDSVASDITAVDRDFDGVIDGAFFGDLGGNIWFAHLAPGQVSRWRLDKVASLGRYDRDKTDRRFFNRANLVRTYLDQQPVDLLMIGSGNRASPLAKNSDDALYILDVTSWLAGVSTMPPQALSNDDLIEADNDNDNYTLEAPVDAAGRFDADAFHGWRIRMSRGVKVLSSTATVGGSTLFTAYQPITAANICLASRGSSRLYGFTLPTWSLVEGKRVQQKSDVRQTELGEYLLDTPTLLVKGQRTYALDSESADRVASVLDSEHQTDESGSGKCGQYDALTGAFQSCLVATPVWWYQQ